MVLGSGATGTKKRSKCYRNEHFHRVYPLRMRSGGGEQREGGMLTKGSQNRRGFD